MTELVENEFSDGPSHIGKVVGLLGGSGILGRSIHGTLDVHDLLPDGLPMAARVYFVGNPLSA